jgi:hypothetical protein
MQIYCSTFEGSDVTVEAAIFNSIFCTLERNCSTLSIEMTKALIEKEE